MVDWTVVETSGAPEAVRLVPHLRIVESVARLQRDLPVGEQPAAPGDTTTPGVWGHLRLVERIGCGSFGDVFRAWDTRLDREVALKILPAGSSSDASTRGAFIREGRLLAKVRHPNVVTIYGAERRGDRIGLWMELVRGQTLEELLRSGTSFTTDEVVRIGVEVTRAVEAVHAAGVLHRDVKAQNVLRADDGRLVLMDFGAGLELGERPSELTGTPLYLAPEVFEGRSATPRSDVYSVGVLLFHLLSRSYPVTGRSPRDVHDAHRDGRRLSIREVRPDLPRRIARVVERAIDPQPERRYESAWALAEALSGVSREARRRRVMAFVGGMAAIAAMAWLVVEMRSGSSRGAESGGAISGSFVDGASTGPWWAPQRPADLPLIAVLPFAASEADPNATLLAAGLTSELIDRLATIEDLRVVSSASAFALSARGRSTATVRRETGADFVLDGEFRGTGDAVLLTIRLMRLADGVILLTDTREHRLSSLENVSEEVALGIVNRLSLRPGRAQRQYEVDLDTYLMYLKARGLQARTFMKSDEAPMLYAEVVRRAPSYAPGWAGLASALGWNSRLRPPGEASTELESRLAEAAREAIRLAPDLAEAQSAVAGLHALRGDWEAAEQSFATAIELNPSLTEVHLDAAWLLLAPLGRFDHALELLETARAVNPLSLAVHRGLACLQVESGRPDLLDDSIRTSRWVLDQDPDIGWTEVCLGRALVLAGRPDEAEPIFRRRLNYWPYLGYLYAVTGRRQLALELADAHPEAPARQMLVFGGLGDKERAFRALEQIAAVNLWRAATWMQWPEVALLRDDARYVQIRRRLGLPD